MSTMDASGSQSKSLLSVFESHADPVLTAVEVSDELGVSQQAAHRKLSKAHDRGELKRKKAGARAVVWWPAGQDFSSQ